MLDPDQWTNHLRIHLTFSETLQWAATLSRDKAFGEEALEHLAPLVEDSRPAPWIRASASIESASIYFDILGDPTKSTMRLLRAYKLIPSALQMGMNRPDQLRLLSDMFDIPAYALVMSLANGTSPQTALEVFEYGRGIFWELNFNRNRTLPMGEVGQMAPVYKLLRRLSTSSLGEARPPLAASPDDLIAKLVRGSTVGSERPRCRHQRP
jgi:hypothetical protein